MVGRKRFLIDTNIILELLLEFDRTNEVRRFFEITPLSDIFMSDFSVYSLGILLTKRKYYEVFKKFVNDFLKEISILRLTPNELIDVIKIMKKYNLDFDDAYQYTIAEKYDLQIISFDGDFDRTERGRKEPKEVIK